MADFNDIPNPETYDGKFVAFQDNGADVTVLGHANTISELYALPAVTGEEFLIHKFTSRNSNSSTSRYADDATYSYTGDAPIGFSTADPVWTITRHSSSGSMVARDVAWDNYLTVEYQ